MSAKNQFSTANDLASWLQSQGVTISAWGCNGSKSVGNLWNELHRGETQLKGDPPLRIVHVVRVIIRRDTRVLIEASQLFTDGRKRARNRLPSEKLVPGEDPLEAARRCLIEEMAVLPECITTYPDTYRREQIITESSSYPGLNSCYRFHVVEASVIGLPDVSFSTNEQAPGPGEPVSRHFWEWREGTTPAPS